MSTNVIKKQTIFAKLSLSHLRNNFNFICFVLVYVIINSILFTSRAYQFLDNISTACALARESAVMQINEQCMNYTSYVLTRASCSKQIYSEHCNYNATAYVLARASGRSMHITTEQYFMHLKDYF